MRDELLLHEMPEQSPAVMVIIDDQDAHTVKLFWPNFEGNARSVTAPAIDFRATQPVKCAAVERCHNVLVVEDDAAIRAFIKFLVQREHWAAEEVSDGTEALSRIRNRRYDAIVLDLMLPGVSGEAILDEIRRSDPSTLRRVVIVTASPSLLQKLDITGVGATLVKPFEIDDLMTALRACTAA